MPKGKRIEIIRRIQAAGYLREFGTAPHLNLPRLTIEMNPWHSFVFDYCGGMGVILELRITSNRTVRVQDFGNLELLGKTCNIDWWLNGESNVYSFSHGPEYPRDVVLNHRIGKCVEPRDPLEGVLLGRSAKPIPSQYPHGLRLPLMLSVLDGFDNPHTAQLLVQVDEHLCTKNQRPSRRSLYGPSRNELHLVDGWTAVRPKEGEQAVTDGSEVDFAEPQTGGTARAPS